MKIKQIIIGLAIGALIGFVPLVFAQNLRGGGSFWRMVSNQIRPSNNAWDIWSSNDLRVDGDIDLSNSTVAVSLVAATNALNIDSNTLVVDASNDRVGIGTNAPSYTLSSVATGTSGYFGIGLNSSNQGSIFAIDGDGKVGIGTDSPTSALDIGGLGVLSLGGIQFGQLNSGDFRIGNPGGGGTQNLQFLTGGNFRMIIDTSGNLGINTTGPDRKLDVLDATNPQLRLTHTDGSVFVDFQADSNGDLVITPSGNSVLFPNGVAGTPAMSFESDTDVGIYRIGTDAMGLVAGGFVFLTLNETTQNELVVNDSSLDMDFRVESDNNAQALFVRGNTGNIGIATTTPTATLTVNGSTAFFGSTDQSLSAGTTLPLTDTLMRVVGNGGAIILTSTPNIADGVDGQILYVRGTNDTNTVTFQDQDVLAGSGLGLPSNASFTMGLGDNCVFQYDLGDDLWWALSCSDN